MNHETISQMRKALNKKTGAKTAILCSPEIISLARRLEDALNKRQAQ